MSSAQNTPILAVTAYPNHIGKNEALQAGCDDYLVKPSDTRALARNEKLSLRWLLKSISHFKTYYHNQSNYGDYSHR